MIAPDIVSEKGKSKPVICKLCYNDTRNRPQIVKLGTEYQLICS